MVRPSCDKINQELCGDVCIEQLSSIGTRKRGRKRALPSEILGIVNAPPTKSRRVDPEKLALRLAPELVAAMEVLIAQGTRMPTFEVRKELQERYNVDRRHVYDYFHSRGMRVAKEDKHRNLSRRRAQAQLNKSTPPSSSILSPMRSLLTPPPTSPIGATDSSKEPDLLPSSQVTENQTITCSKDPIGKISEPTFTEADAINSPVERGHSATSPDACKEEAEQETDPQPKEEDQTAEADVDFYLDELMGILLDSCVDDCFDFPITGDEATIAAHNIGSEMDTKLTASIWPIDTLSAVERLEHYEIIDNSIGQVQGFAESLGTYKTYMQERSRIYYSRLTSCPCKLGRGVQSSVSHTQQCHPVGPSDIFPKTIPGADTIFQPWLRMDASSTGVFATSLPPNLELPLCDQTTRVPNEAEWFDMIFNLPPDTSSQDSGDFCAKITFPQDQCGLPALVNYPKLQPDNITPMPDVIHPSSIKVAALDIPLALLLPALGHQDTAYNQFLNAERPESSLTPAMIQKLNVHLLSALRNTSGPLNWINVFSPISSSHLIKSSNGHELPKASSGRHLNNLGTDLAFW